MLDHRLPRRKIILIVESNQERARLLQETLAQETAYGAVRVSTGTHALTVLSTVLPDLVLLTPDLPDMSGEDLCGQIRQVEKLKALPLLLLGTDRPRDERLGLALPLQREAFLRTLAYLFAA